MKRRHGVLITGLSLVVAASALPGPWRAARLGANPTPQGSAPVRTIPAGSQFAAKPGEKGATFYWLEGQATRLTARYPEGVVEVQRGGDGDILTRVFDASGNERAHLNVDTATDTLMYVPGPSGNDAPLQVMNDSKVRPTMDWAHRQAYALWKGGTVGLAWKNGLMRAAAHRDVEPSELEIIWKDGLTAKVQSKANAKSRLVETGSRTERVLSGPALVSRLVKDGLEIGSSSWYPKEQLFMWHLPNTSGFIEAKHLKPHFGGWPFTPDQEWVNLQTIAFYHFKTQIDTNRFVARDSGSNGGACRVGRPASLAGKLLDFFAPTVQANEPGCDGLHWLDGSVLRFCCDIHDACYAKYGCDYSSWWRIWKSWTCDYCNMNVIMCFADGGCTCYPGYGWLQPADDLKKPAPQANT